MAPGNLPGVGPFLHVGLVGLQVLMSHNQILDVIKKSTFNVGGHTTIPQDLEHVCSL